MKTSISKLPALALIAGLAISATMMSFKSNNTLDERYYNTGSGWKTESQISSENPGFIPVCVGEEPVLCSGVYNENETPGVDTPDAPQFGDYQLIPE